MPPGTTAIFCRARFPTRAADDRARTVGDAGPYRLVTNRAVGPDALIGPPGRSDASSCHARIGLMAGSISRPTPGRAGSAKKG